MTDSPATPGAEAPAGLRPSLASQQVVIRDSGLFPWWSVVGLGIVSVLLGIVVVGWPTATLKVMAALAGLWLLLGGLVRIFSAFVSGRGVGRQMLSGIVGVVLVIVGVACLRDLVRTVELLAVVVAVTWLLSGIAEVVMAADAKRGGSRVALLATGLISIVLGLVFLFVPRFSLGVLVLMTGLGFILTGAMQVVVGLQLRRSGPES
ncbi:HdeD family acid-resistance protein [Virgisporangium aurantiacum]|uniref:HdeD family acid-resistance protein n=1 Tax=Virgisporangium aurantiacum TaxID=175570 RepID=A0A8J4E120_9ACTN|nr:DUF308 domain-containing protein [Virgisporangium aurantiacum]GIJ55572.1 hypothetical protein Vau01_030880 [Virgisporangium aurantiacum]